MHTSPAHATSSFVTFDNTYARDLKDFCIPWQPEAATRPTLRCFNQELACELGMAPDFMRQSDSLSILAGNSIPPGATPVAQAYAGHQFGGFSPKLGDGRALLLGETIDRFGKRRDIAFKGSGRTPFSRNGDGKCALGPALREYLMGEAMHALGVPTTRSLAVVSTGEMIRRDRPLPGAVLTRVAASHLRVGTFEYFAVHHGPDSVRQLADYAIARHYPALATHDAPCLALLEALAERQAELIARWLGIGFIHGVMNTDNMTISGETIDYGPCAFMETYHPDTVFSSIDRHGRYAYGQQAAIAQWNLARFAETLLPLIDPDIDVAIVQATRIIENFPKIHQDHWLTVMRAKLGLDHDGDAAVDHVLAQDFLTLLQTGQCDFTQACRALIPAAQGELTTLTRRLGDVPGYSDWVQRWQHRQPARSAELLAAMQRANPCFIPRNHLVENALDAAVDRNDMAPFESLLAAIRHPFEETGVDSYYAEPAPKQFTDHYQTFCGT